MELAKAILYLFPDAKPDVDFSVKADGDQQEIEFWNLSESQPTSEELAEAWENVQTEPPVEKEDRIDILERSILELADMILTPDGGDGS